MSNCDEHRLTEKQLKWLKAPKNTKGRAECLAQLEVEEHRPSGKYLTEIDRWTCSCPALDNLSFFFKLRRQRYPPYYMIQGIHEDQIPDGPDGDDSDDADSANIRVLGRDIRMGRVNEGTSDRASQGQLPLTEMNRHQSQRESDMEQREVVTDEHSVTNVEGAPIEEDTGEEINHFEGNESEEEGDRVYYTAEESKTLKRCFSDMMELIDRKGGVHHKMAGILDKVFNGVKKVGGDIGEHKRWRMSQRT